LPDSKTIPPAVTAAMEFLKWTLWERFRCTWPQLVELAAKEEIAEITLRRARDELKLHSRRRCLVICKMGSTSSLKPGLASTSSWDRGMGKTGRKGKNGDSVLFGRFFRKKYAVTAVPLFLSARARSGSRTVSGGSAINSLHCISHLASRW
jgi:hypothetical protein